MDNHTTHQSEAPEVAPRRVITQKDIAFRAGVSQFAVSAVLRGGASAERFSEHTRRRIIETAAAAGYQPSRAAQALRSGSTGTIGLWMVRSHNRPHALYTYHLHRLARADRLHLLLSETTDTHDEVQEEETWEWPADAVLAVDSGGRIERYRQMRGDRLPIVSAGWNYSPAVDHIAIDLWSGSRAAIDHILAIGRRQVVFLGTALVSHSQEARCATYEQRMKAQGLPVRLVIASESTRLGGLIAIRDLLSSGASFDAIFSADEALAIGAYRALREAERRIPSDVALVTFGDEEPDLPYFDVPITGVSAPIAEASEIAWRFLRRRMQEPGIEKQSCVLPTTLRIRASSAG